MSRNPFLNAFAASAYITVFVLAINYAPKDNIPEDGIIIPIAFLSLFVLSAALMGYFFLYQPMRFLFEGKPKESTKLFLLTIAVFACITGVVLLSLFFVSTLL